MLIRGQHSGVVNGTGGLGLAVVDPRRADLAPSGPGYVEVTFGGGNDGPPQPYFASVSSALGQVSVALGCSVPVDGYELVISTEAFPPTDGSSSMFSPTGNYTIPAAQGTQYLHARTVKAGVRSAWTSYGAPAPGTEEWNKVFEESPLQGADGADFPACAEVIGFPVRSHAYGGVTCLWPSMTVYDGGHTVGILTADGVSVSRHGGRCSMKIACETGMPLAGTGVAFLARDQVLTNFTTESFYVLFYYVVNAWQGAGNDQRIILGKFVNGVYAEIARSNNLYPAFIGLGNPEPAFVFQWVGNTFRVTIDNLVAWTYANDDIPAGDERGRIGLYFLSRYGYSKRTIGYLKFESRNYGDGAQGIDPGIPGDSLREGVLQEHFPLSHYARSASYNATKDCLHLRRDDAGSLKVECYGEDGARRPESDVTLTPDKSFTFTQNNAAATWAITHNLGKYPTVTVVDTGGNTVLGDVLFNSISSLTLTFSAPFSGTAYLN